MLGDRPVVAAVHPSLIAELKLRKEAIENETGRKTRGGLTCFSEMAAHELKCMRMSGEQLMKEIMKLKGITVYKFQQDGVEKEFVAYEIFKKLYVFSSALSRKKDGQQIKLEISKVKGMKKNDIRYFY